MKNTIEINGKTFTLDELNILVEKAKKENPMEEIFKYHNIKEKNFDKQYENIPEYLKYMELEFLIVSFYNKKEKVDWKNGNQHKYTPWFILDENNFRYYRYTTDSPGSNTSSRSAFLRKSDMLEAVEKFIHIYKKSRL